MGSRASSAAFVGGAEKELSVILIIDTYRRRWQITCFVVGWSGNGLWNGRQSCAGPAVIKW